MKLRQIAGHLGVSPATVSLALKGDPRVNAATRERVRDYCKEVKYAPSFSARNLSAGRSYTLHLINLLEDGNGTDRFLTDFLAGASKAVAAQNYRITLSLLRDSEWARLSPHLRDGSADGFLLLNPRETDDYRIFQEANARLLVIGRYNADWGERVDSDNVAVGRDIGRHLYAQGYKRPALLGPIGQTFTTDRLNGLRQIYPKTSAFDCGDIPGTLAGSTRAIRRDFDALIVTDDALLPGALKALKACGCHCPDIGVVGMGNDLSPYLEPEITSIDFDAQRLGEVAATRLLEMIAAPGGVNTASRKPIIVPHRLLPRSSTQRPLLG